MRASIVNIILGLWLMISPALLRLQNDAANNNYIFGTVILTFAIIALWEVNRSVRIFNLIPAIWLTVSPFILELPVPLTLWSTALPALCIAGFSLIKGSIKKNYGGGWRSLFVKDPSQETFRK